ncbi:hypothetical protein N7470_002855 [Penicillium chermesinum]|nr:hypothetical protein N7470_002855 [Penicillium chermesinum]
MFGYFGQPYDACKLAILTTGLSLVAYFVIKLMQMSLKLLAGQPAQEPGFEDTTREPLPIQVPEWQSENTSTYRRRIYTYQDE